MFRLSVIVPLLGSVDRFEDTLASILRHRPTDAQVIVVHDGSYRDPYRLASEVQFLETDPDSGLIGSLNVGLCYAGGEFTIIARPGVELDEDWDTEISHAMQDDKVAAVVPMIFSQQYPNRIVSAGVSADRSGTRRLVGQGKRYTHRSCRSLRPQGPTSWLAAYRTSIIKSIAPLDETLDDCFIDQDIALSLQSLRCKCVLSDQFRGTIDDANAVFEEADVPHGSSAQRASQRFGDVMNSGSASNALADLLRATVSPWRLKHLVQRFAAGRSVDVDLNYSNRLERLSTDRPWLAKQATEIETSIRRAA